jgi:GAF domain-containing protein
MSDAEVEKLQQRVAELEALENDRARSEKVQAALYRIAEIAGAAQDMQEFYAEIHRIVGELMYAENLYIALYDDTRQMINFPYFVDEVDTDVPDPHVWEPFGIGNAAGTTAYLLRIGRPLFLTLDDQRTLVERGELRLIGEESIDWVGAPLKAEDRTIGAIVVQSYRPESRHSEADLELLTFVAGHIASALQRTRLIDETRQRSAELALVNDVQRGLAENLEMQAMYDLVGDRIQEIFDAQVVDIGIVNPETGKIDFKYTIERGVRFFDEPIEIVGFRKIVLETREPVVVNDELERRSAEAGQPLVISGEQPRSGVFVPLVIGDRGTGVISLQNIDREHAFSEADVRLLTTLAGSLSVALENARLFEETRQRNAELALINDVQAGLAQNLEMQAMYDLVGDRVRDIFDAQVVSIAVLDPDEGLVRFPYTIEKGARFEVDPMAPIGFRKHVLETREPLLFEVITPELIARYDQPEVLVGEVPKSSVWVPLIVAGRSTGVISLQNVEREKAFSETDLRLLMTLAGSLSVALENARLFEETRQRNAELALITDVQRGLAQNLEMQAMYDLVGDRIYEIFDTQSVDIGILDPESGLMASPYTIEKGVRYREEPIEVSSGPSRYVLDTGETLVFNDRMMERVEELGGAPFGGSGDPPRSGIYVPLVVGGKAIGRITLQNMDRDHAFSESDIRLLTAIAGSLSVALENARLFEETKQRNAELAVITDVQRGLAENLEMQAMYDLVGDRIREIFDAPMVDIAILDPDDGLLHYPYQIEKGVRFPDEPTEVVGMGGHVMRTREPLLINERWAERAPEFGAFVHGGEQPMSVLFVPLVVGGEAIGRISLQNLDREYAFSDADVGLLTTIAGSLSVALQNARLFEETRQRAAELATVNDVGQALAEQLELDALIDRLGDQLRDLFEADIVYIALHDASIDMIEFPYYSEEGRRDPY